MDCRDVAIEQIVRRVVAEIGGDIFLKSQEEVLILAPRDSDGFRRMEQCLNAPGCIRSVDDSPGDLPAVARRCSQVILPSLCPVGMADLALGRAGSGVLMQVLSLLLNGVEVLVGEYQYEQYETSAPAALYKTYQEYEARLQKFGLKRFSAAEPKKQTPCAGRLLTEEHVRQAASSGQQELHLAAETLVTALAADSAREYGITLVRGQRGERR